MANDDKGLVAQASPDALAAFQGVGETGFEETTRDDYSMPFLLLLQDLSPQVKPQNSKYMVDAKPGLFLDQASGELMESLQVIPCLYQRKMVEWKPRKMGGGFVAVHEVGFEEKLPRDEHGSYLTKDGTEVKDTRYFFCLRVNEKDGSLSPLILAMTSTQIKKAKDWLTKMERMKMDDGRGGSFTPPMFSHIWKISSETETRQANTFFGFKIEKVGPVTAEVFQKMKEWRETFKKTSSTIKPIDVDTDTTAGGEGKM